MGWGHGDSEIRAESPRPGFAKTGLAMLAPEAPRFAQQPRRLELQPTAGFSRLLQNPSPGQGPFALWA
eukprot:12168408-Alexandrium_andersonii.AAC.1